MFPGHLRSIYRPGLGDQSSVLRGFPAARPHNIAPSHPPAPLDLTLIQPKRHLANADGAAPLDLSTKRSKATPEDDIGDDVIIVGMQQAPARYAPFDATRRVPSYYDPSAVNGRHGECEEQGFSRDARARNLTHMCTSSPHHRGSSSQVEFLRRWSREPSVNLCAQAPSRPPESEATRAYERPREPLHQKRLPRDLGTESEYLGRGVMRAPMVTPGEQLLQQQLLQQQHIQSLKHQQQQQIHNHQQEQQQQQHHRQHHHHLHHQHQQPPQESRHAGMLSRDVSVRHPSVTPSSVVTAASLSQRRAVAISETVPNRAPQVDVTRQSIHGNRGLNNMQYASTKTSKLQYDDTIANNMQYDSTRTSKVQYDGTSANNVRYNKSTPVHTAHDVHNAAYSVISQTLSDNAQYLYGHEMGIARTPQPYAPTPPRYRSTSGERALSSTEVEQHIRKSLDQAASLVQTPRVSDKQHTLINGSSMFPARPEVDPLRCGASSSALYRAMLNGSEPIGQPKVAAPPTGRVPLGMTRDEGVLSRPYLQPFRNPDSVPRSRGDVVSSKKRTLPPPLLYSPHLCLPDNRHAVSGRGSAEQRQTGPDVFDRVASSASLRGPDTRGPDTRRLNDSERRSNLSSHSDSHSTNGVVAGSSETSGQIMELKQLRHAPYLLSMLTSSQKAELSSSEQQRMAGIVRRQDATPTGGSSVAGPQDQYMGSYTIPAQRDTSGIRSAIASADQQQARRKCGWPSTDTTCEPLPPPYAKSSLKDEQMAQCNRRTNATEVQASTDGDAHDLGGSTQPTLPSGIRYYKCPTATKPFTKPPTGDAVSDDKFPSKQIPVANVNPIVKSSYKSGVRAGEYHGKTGASAVPPVNFSRMSASTFSSGVITIKSDAPTATDSCTGGVSSRNDAPVKAIESKTCSADNDPPPVKCNTDATVCEVRKIEISEPSLCSRRDLELYLSTPKGRQKLKLRENLMSVGGDETIAGKPKGKPDICVTDDQETEHLVDAPSCGDVKTNSCDAMPTKLNKHADPNDSLAVDNDDLKPDEKATCSAAHVNGDPDNISPTNASPPCGQPSDKFMTRKSRILESIRKKSSQHVPRLNRQKNQRLETSSNHRKAVRIGKTKERSASTKVSGERKRKLRRSRRLTGHVAHATDLPRVSRIKSVVLPAAPRRSRRVTSYNKNAAYEEELQKDEERRLLLRAKRIAHGRRADHVTQKHGGSKRLCRLRSARRNRVFVNRKRKQASVPNVDLGPEGDGGCPSTECPVTVEEDGGRYSVEGIVEVKAEPSPCTTGDDDVVAEQSGTVEKPTKAKRKKLAARSDKSRSTCSGQITAHPAPDEMIPGHIIDGPAPGELLPGHGTALSAPGELLPDQSTVLPAPDQLVAPPVMKGVVKSVRRYRRKTKAYYKLSHEHRSHRRFVAKNRDSVVGGRFFQRKYQLNSLAARLGNQLCRVKTEPGEMSNQDPYGEDTDTEGGYGEVRDFTADAKRLVVCKKTGETTLHKAARLGYESVVSACIESQVVPVSVRDNAGYTPLHESCVTGGLAIVRRLLAAGADVNAASQDGTRPIHDAVDNDHLEIVRLLLSCGADPSISTYSGRSPLKLARSVEMDTFLKGYFDDLNGLAEDDPGPWQFKYSAGVVGNDSVGGGGCDIFNDVPSDPEVEDDVVEFTFCADPQLFAYHLCLVASKGSRNYYSASDVAHRLDIGVDELAATYGDSLTLAAAGRAQLKEQLYPSCIFQVNHIKELLAASQVNVFTFVEVDDAAGRLLGDVIATTPLFDSPGASGSNDAPGVSTAGKELIGNVIRRTPTYGDSVNNCCAYDDESDSRDSRKEKGKQRDGPKTVRQSGKVRTCTGNADGVRDMRRAPSKLSRKYRSHVEVKHADSNSVIDGVQGASPDLDTAKFDVRDDGCCSPDTVIRVRDRLNDEGSCREPGRPNRQVNGVESTCYAKQVGFTCRNNLTPPSLCNVVCASETDITSVNSLDQHVKQTEQRDTSLISRKRPVCPATPSAEKTHTTSASNPGQRRRSVSASSCCHSNVADDASTSDDPALPVLEKHEIECETEPPAPNSQPLRADSGVYDDSEMPELICCAY